MALQVVLLVFDDVEVLDACGPFEVFSVASRLAVRRGEPPPFEVTLVGAATADHVRARGGMRIAVDDTVAASPRADVVLVPGGLVADVAGDPAVQSWLRDARGHATVIASVCTGAFVLAASGLLDHRPVTTHWEDLDELRQLHPELDVRAGVRFIDHGDIATSAGISAGLDLALHLVGRLVGPETAMATARQMDYDWVAER